MDTIASSFFIKHPSARSATSRSSTGDYSTKQGVMASLTINIPVCHTKINSFRWIIELLVGYRSHRKWATPTNRVRYTDQEKLLYKAAREDNNNKTNLLSI